MNDRFLSPYFFVFVIVFFVVCITVMTLVHSTKQVTKGYELNAVDGLHRDLVKEREIMDMKISDVRSLKFIQESEKVRKMTRPRQVVYINPDTAIASIR